MIAWHFPQVALYMQQLFQFLYRYRAFILFVLLESLSLWLVVKHNNYQSAAFFNSSNKYAAEALSIANSVTEYVNLREVNADLANENRRLHTLLTQIQLRKDTGIAPYKADSAFAARFNFRVAKVINNSTQRFNNYLTIDKGSQDGLRKGMGVISATGAVGKIQSCSAHFSTIVSLLHSDMQVSSKIKRNNVFGTAKWPGKKSSIINLTYIPRHQSVMKGDTVVTSDYNSTFPVGIMIGKVQAIRLKQNDAYYEIDVALSTNFNNLSFVYVIENKLEEEQQVLEEKNSLQN